MTLCPLAAALVLLAAVPALAQKPVVLTEADLPRFSYPLPEGIANASELLQNRAALAEVAARLEADTAALLADNDIRDAATLTALHSSLANLALLRGDDDAALAQSAASREAAETPAERLVSGLSTEAVVAARQAVGDEASRHAAFRTHYAASIAALPWDVVQDVVMERRGRTASASANALLGFAQERLDPDAASTGEISREVAQRLVNFRVAIDAYYPYNDDALGVLTEYITANRVVKPDIWAARSVTLSAADTLTPVVVGIWDTGVDPGVFPEQMFTNAAETVDGLDDDGDGFVDDVHGIGYGMWGGEPSAELLLPIEEAERERLPESLSLIKGYLDAGASLDTPEAIDFLQRMAVMQPGDVRPFVDHLNLLFYHSHGSLVAGVAAAGNPAIRLLVVRETFPHETVEAPVTLAVARRWAVNMQRSVDYVRHNGARVVNMSWGLTGNDIVTEYEANGIGETPEEQQQMAQEAHGVLMAAMMAAMRSAPDVLFVTGAGNGGDDLDVVADVPASIRLPNLITVGAVDQAGDEASFTSRGAIVRVYAHGVEVESTAPGGTRIAMSGTSLSAPQVTNLAAKLFALDPSLTAARAAALILDGADRSADGRIALLNPARSVAILRGDE